SYALLASFLALLTPPRRSPRFPYTTLFRSPGRSHVLLGAVLSHARVVVPARPVSHHQVASIVRHVQPVPPGGGSPQRGEPPPGRSEEHTSELQSRFDLVCRLLLEKKKNTAQ